MSVASQPLSPARTAPRGRQGERKSDRTRRRVLAAAKHLFDRRGYRDTTVDDITRRAEIAHGTFYLYFRGKSEILSELSVAALAEFDSIATREFQTREEVVSLVRQTLEAYQRNRLTMRLLREASATDAHFREHYDEVFLGTLVDHLRHNVERINAGLPAADRIDARAAARAIVGMIESFAYGISVGGEKFTIDEAVEVLSTVCIRATGMGR
ncbi:MAG: TetR/AcrR family transcriptional regulator [Candidatus Dormibacteraeota bacterium]|nr:TetR/AcrR family transcriptional regulator [Candidatus Dormibacteraeota bacterium]